MTRKKPTAKPAPTTVPGRASGPKAAITRTDGAAVPVGSSARGVSRRRTGDVQSLLRDISATKAREQAERRLRELLTRLHDVTIDLSKTRPLDDLCRRAVELGRRRLGFDRLGLWFSTPTGEIEGSFGTDERGRLRDERGVHIHIPPNAEIARLLANETRLAVHEDTHLPDHHAQPVGRGTHMLAALWDGGRVIGFLGADNLIRHRPFDMAQRQVLVLYAAALGHLCSRARAAEELRVSEEKYRQLFSTETDAIILTDVQTLQFIDVNESACRLYGYTREEFLSLNMLDVTADPAVSGPSVRETIRKKKILVQLRYHKKKDGTTFPVEISASTFVFRGREVLCGAIRDITKRVRAEEALRAATAKLTSARDEERRRLSRELHDSVGQALIAARLKLQAAARIPSVAEHPVLSRIVAELSGQVVGLTQEVRQVSRALYPPTLETLGLPAALQQLARDWQSARTKVTVRCDTGRQGGCPQEVSIALYRIAQEAVSNAVRHGKPPHVNVRLNCAKGQVHLAIRNDGRGFDPEKATGKGLGLLSMRERADAIGAAFRVTSEPGRTCVEVRIPGPKTR